MIESSSAAAVSAVAVAVAVAVSASGLSVAMGVAGGVTPRNPASSAAVAAADGAVLSVASSTTYTDTQTQLVGERKNSNTRQVLFPFARLESAATVQRERGAAVREY